MTMDHPVADILGLKFDVACLGNTHQDRISRVPGRFRDTPPLGSSYYKLMAVKVHRVVVHPQIDETKTNAFALPRQHWSRRRPGLPINSQPVEFHSERVRHCVVGKNSPLLQD